MATMNLSLPHPMKEWVEAQAKTGRYSNASDYVRDLICRDQMRGDKIAAMQEFVDEGLQSGKGTMISLNWQLLTPKNLSNATNGIQSLCSGGRRYHRHR